MRYIDERFVVNERVRSIVNYPDDNYDIHIGDEGTIVKVRSSLGDIGVRWDNRIKGGHTCGFGDSSDICPSGYGWFVNPNEIEIVPFYDGENEEIANEAELMAFIGI